MKAISDKTFRRLKDYVENPKFIPEAVKEGSLAAMSICVWIRAVYHFCVVYREYFPKQQRVIEAKKILDEVDFEFFMSVLIRKEIRKRSSQTLPFPIIPCSLGDPTSPSRWGSNSALSVKCANIFGPDCSLV